MTEDESSSVADATDCTLVEASSEAAATVDRQRLRTFGGRRQRAGGGFELGRSRRHGLDDLADHGFEIAGDAVDAAAALDLGFGVHRGGLVGGLLGDQRLLEHLQGVRHGADFGLLALMRHLRAQIALAQRLHRRDDGGDAGRRRREPDSS